jgi:hypothetical protein
MELVDVVGGGVAGEADDEQIACSRFAEHLRAHGSPARDGMRRELPLAEEFVGGFGGAGVRAGKDLGVGEDEVFFAGDGVSAEVKPGGEVSGLELRLCRGGWRCVVEVSGVDSVDAEYAADARVGGRVAEDLAECAAARAPSAEFDLVERDAGGGLGFCQEVGKGGWIGEQFFVGAGTGAGLHSEDRQIVLLRGGEFREPVASVEEEEEVDVALALQFFRNEEGADAEFLAEAGRSCFGESRVGAGVLDHGGWILLLLGEAVRRRYEDEQAGEGGVLCVLDRGGEFKHRDDGSNWVRGSSKGLTGMDTDTTDSGGSFPAWVRCSP